MELPKRIAPLGVTTGRQLAVDRLLMGVAKSSLAAAIGTNAYWLQVKEHSRTTLNEQSGERWRRALATLAEQRLAKLRDEGWTIEDLPPAMREAFARYVPNVSDASDVGAERDGGSGHVQP